MECQMFGLGGMGFGGDGVAFKFGPPPGYDPREEIGQMIKRQRERDREMRERQAASREKWRQVQEETARKANSPPALAMRRIRETLAGYQARVRKMGLSRTVQKINIELRTAMNTLKDLSRYPKP